MGGQKMQTKEENLSRSLNATQCSIKVKDKLKMNNNNMANV